MEHNNLEAVFFEKEEGSRKKKQRSVYLGCAV